MIVSINSDRALNHVQESTEGDRLHRKPLAFIQIQSKHKTEGKFALRERRGMAT